jgi:hypothetical protein
VKLPFPNISDRPVRENFEFLVKQLVALIARVTALEGRVAAGTQNITWPGATQLSNNIVVPHGLGVLPLQCSGITNTALVTVAVVTFDATNITFQCRDNSGVRGAGTFGALRWLAIRP